MVILIGKKKQTRIVTFNAGTYFYKVRGSKSHLQAGENDTVVLASRTDSMFDVAMRYRYVLCLLSFRSPFISV